LQQRTGLRVPDVVVGSCQLKELTRVLQDACGKRTCAWEAEESPQLEAVARELVVTTQQAEKFLAYAALICELWRVSIVLRVVSINPVSNP
jgi:hypothetical protein